MNSVLYGFAVPLTGCTCACGAEPSRLIDLEPFERGSNVLFAVHCLFVYTRCDPFKPKLDLCDSGATFGSGMQQKCNIRGENATFATFRSECCVLGFFEFPHLSQCGGVKFPSISQCQNSECCKCCVFFLYLEKWNTYIFEIVGGEIAV